MCRFGDTTVVGKVDVNEEQKNAAVPNFEVGMSIYPNPTDVCLILFAQHRWVCLSFVSSLYPCSSCLLFVVVICDPSSICIRVLISWYVASLNLS